MLYNLSEEGSFLPTSRRRSSMLNRRSVSSFCCSFLSFLSLSLNKLSSCVVLILQGHVPLFVNATAGSTVYGAFDPINEIADICEKYNLWLHVDVSSWHWKILKALKNIFFIFLCFLVWQALFSQGAWGGGLLMSRKHRHKLSGVERWVCQESDFIQKHDRRIRKVKMTNMFTFAGLTLSHGTLTRWWECLYSALQSWSERRCGWCSRHSSQHLVWAEGWHAKRWTEANSTSLTGCVFL